MIQLMRLLALGRINKFIVENIEGYIAITIYNHNNKKFVFEFIDDNNLIKELIERGFELDGAPYA